MKKITHKASSFIIAIKVKIETIICVRYCHYK